MRTSVRFPGYTGIEKSGPEPAAFWTIHSGCHTTAKRISFRDATVWQPRQLRLMSQQEGNFTVATPTINWPGQSGTQYQYWIHPIGTEFVPKPGNYVFAKEVRPHHWVPIYIGQTSNLAERFDNHHQMDAIKREGATHIHVHTSSEKQQVRLDEETDLCRRWKTPCNGKAAA